MEIKIEAEVLMKGLEALASMQKSNLDAQMRAIELLAKSIEKFGDKFAETIIRVDEINFNRKQPEMKFRQDKAALELEAAKYDLERRRARDAKKDKEETAE